MSFRGRKRQFNKNHYQKKFSNEKPRDVEKLNESDVAITEYLSTLPSIPGIIKSRYSDFHVSEINLNGEIAKLTDIDIPSNFNANPDIDDDEVLTYPTEFISEETWARLKALVETEDLPPVDIDVTNLSKEDRTKIHETVKKLFGKKIVASTKTVEDKKFVEVKRHLKGTPRDNRSNWPKQLGEYVYFLTYKEGIDTIQTTFKISDRLKINSSAITYAGVKDRRAKTTQWFCVKKLNPKKLINGCKCFRNIHVGNVQFKNEPLKLGQLDGNKFRIAIRNVTVDDSSIATSMDFLKSNGFINYYGLQRFGNDKDVPTFEVGVKLLQGSWKEACDLILKSKASDEPNSDLTRAKDVYKKTSDAQLAYKEFSKFTTKSLEAKLFEGLANNHKNDYVTALENVPRNVRLLYLHAFQSLIWNKVISRRIKEHGLEPIVGDLVLETNGLENEDECDESEEILRPQVKILGAADLCNYTIYDVVMPLPGYDVVYPENEVKTWYKEVLNEYSLSLEMPKQSVKTYNLSGAYRNILSRATDMSWKILKYNHPNDVLIRSDYEELIGETTLEDSPNGEYKAVVVEFCLKSSNYATMALREILKIDTCSVAQKKLNTYFEKKSEENVEFAQVVSLLDSNKYEEFKNNIYGGVEENNDGLKRKHEEEGETVEKKLKNDC